MSMESSQLIKYKPNYTEEKPLKCDVCEKAYVQSSDLISHTLFFYIRNRLKETQGSRKTCA